MSKFIRVVHGPVHFKTRFIPFVENNRDTLHNYVYLVDNYELYEPYKDLLTIIDIEEIRKNHEWSNNDIEVLYQESDHKVYAKNFKKYYEEKNTLLPVCTLRFILLYMYEKEILKFTYIGNNVFMTNKQNHIDDYFNSIPDEEFHFCNMGHIDDKPACVIQTHFGKLIEEKFPNLIIPDNQRKLENYLTGFSFKNKEHIKLFYEIFDYIVKLYNYSDDSAREYFFQAYHGYTRIDDILGYIIRIFEINLNYKIKSFLHYWKNDIIGFHVTTPHDTWYYSAGLPRWNLLPDAEILTSEEYTNKNKNYLIEYYNNHLTYCNFEITDDNKIIITHKNL